MVFWSDSSIHGKINFVAVRTRSFESWRALTYPRWRISLLIPDLIAVILFVYIDSYFFVASTSILQVGVGLTSDAAACEYMSHFLWVLIAQGCHFYVHSLLLLFKGVQPIECVLTAGYHLSLPYRESIHRTRRNHPSIERQVVLVSFDWLDTILRYCYSRNYFPI